MQFEPTEISDVVLIRPRVFDEERGYFFESWEARKFAAAGLDVSFVQDWETAVAVAIGTINAQEAFLQGRITLAGNQRRLVDAQPVFAVLEKVLAPVREATSYA